MQILTKEVWNLLAQIPYHKSYHCGTVYMVFITRQKALGQIFSYPHFNGGNHHD